ncbi:MAG: ABC transporter ATP-binding protein [Solirubrobacterales bacterium]
MLVVEDLVVRYGRVAALQGVSFSVDEGSAVAVVGPNGAGKSSMLSAVVGLVPAASGSIRFDGEQTNGVASERLVRRGMSLVPEGRHIFATLSVMDNLRLGATVRSDQRAAHAQIAELLERFPALGQLRKQSAGKLSGGEQQQLAIARALLSRPRLLMLDEPSLGLAPLIIDQVFDLLEALRKDGVTILLVEQNAARAVLFADHSYVLRTGRVVLEGSTQELLGEHDFVATYLGVEASVAETLTSQGEGT